MAVEQFFLVGGPWDGKVARLHVEHWDGTIVFRVGKWYGKYVHREHEKKHITAKGYPIRHLKWEPKHDTGRD
jgi:hypothetical protein